MCELNESRCNNCLKHHLHTVSAPACKLFLMFMCVFHWGGDHGHCDTTERADAQKIKNPEFKFKICFSRAAMWFWTLVSSSIKWDRWYQFCRIVVEIWMNMSSTEQVLRWWERRIFSPKSPSKEPWIYSLLKNAFQLDVLINPLVPV